MQVAVRHSCNGALLNGNVIICKHNQLQVVVLMVVVVPATAAPIESSSKTLKCLPHVNAGMFLCSHYIAGAGMNECVSIGGGNILGDTTHSPSIKSNPGRCFPDKDPVRQKSKFSHILCVPPCNNRLDKSHKY